MNLILLSSKDFVGNENRVRLKGRRHKHIVSIHKAKVGDKLVVGLGGGLIGSGKVTKLNNQACEMDVDLRKKPPAALPLTLILSLPRPIMLKKVLFTVSSMGVKKIYLIHSNRVEKSFWNSSLLKDEKYKEQIVLGLEQAKDTILPEVFFKKRFKPFVEDELPSIAKGTLSLIAHPEGSIACPSSVKKATTLAIGPEGGFVPYEVEKFMSCGFKPVHLGERILRVETAVPAIISKLFQCFTIRFNSAFNSFIRMAISL